MYRKNLKFKSIIFKLFILYFVIYCLAIIFRLNNNLEDFLMNIKYEYLIIMNIISIILGLPFSVIFDFLLIKIFGFFYILLFAPILTLIGLFQIIFLRKVNKKILKDKYLKESLSRNKIYNLLKNISLKPTYILIIRTFPILPFILGSYLIALSKNNKRNIFTYSLLGAYFYYFPLFFIISNS